MFVKEEYLVNYQYFYHHLTDLQHWLIENCHEETKHGLVGLTMGKVRERFWIVKLRSQVKSIIYHCRHCKKHHGKALTQKTTTPLPIYRTIPSRIFETTGLDFAGPFEYRVSKGEYGKAYLALFTCASSRAVYLDLLRSMEVTDFKRCFKEFVGRRGNPSLMVSDNAKTFESMSKWLKRIRNNADVNTLLAKLGTEWKFNLSRSPWWGGLFERLVGMTKAVLYKSFGKARLSFDQLKEIVLEAEVILNNRPLGYLEDDIQLPPLTPNMLIHGTNITLPEDIVDDDPEYGEPIPARLARHLQRCKDALWKRWTSEYMRALRERHNCYQGDSPSLKVGDIVQVKEDKKNRGEWRLAVVVHVVKKGETVLGARLRMSNNKILERPLQHLYPLELRVEMDRNNETAADVIGKEIPKEDTSTVGRRPEAVKSTVGPRNNAVTESRSTVGRRCEAETEARPGRAAKNKALRNIKTMVEDIMNDDY